jgi:hypothetical protein
MWEETDVCSVLPGRLRNAVTAVTSQTKRAAGKPPRNLRNRPPRRPDRPLAPMYPLKAGLDTQLSSSGSIATSRAASRHNSAGVLREPSSSKMRISFRLRPSSTRTCSRAAVAFSGRSTTSVTPTLELTVNFMAVRASPSRSKTKTSRRWGFSTRAVVTVLALGQSTGACTVNFLLL